MIPLAENPVPAGPSLAVSVPDQVVTDAHQWDTKMDVKLPEVRETLTHISAPCPDCSDVGLM
jgi:hypothetical protein